MKHRRKPTSLAEETRHGLADPRMAARNADCQGVPANAYLRSETLVVSARPSNGPWGDVALNRLHEAIYEFCRSPRSVAEVGAYLNASIEVTRLLLSYAITLGFLAVYDADSAADMRPVELIGRVHDGLRRLA